MNYEVSATPITKYKFRSIKTMKRYIKPNTEMHTIELQSMIANTTLQNNGNSSEKIDDIIKIDSKETEISSPSLWGEEE